MAIITKNDTPAKGASALFTLNKADLLANSVVSADAYFSSSSNWSKVALFYKTTVGNQASIVSFDATLTTPTASMVIADTARDVFEIVRIIIFDKQGGFLEVPRANLTTADFDVDLTPAVDFFTTSVQNPTGWTITSGIDSLDVTGTGGTDWDGGFLSNISVPNTSDVEFSFTVGEVGYGVVGFSQVDTLPSYGSSDSIGFLGNTGPCFLFDHTGNVNYRAWDESSAIAGAGTYQVGDTFKITITSSNTVFSFYKNDSLVTSKTLTELQNNYGSSGGGWDPLVQPYKISGLSWGFSTGGFALNSIVFQNI